MVRVIKFREDFRFFTAPAHDLTVFTHCRHLARSPYRDGWIVPHLLYLGTCYLANMCGTDTVSNINNDCRPWVLKQSYMRVHGRNGRDSLRYIYFPYLFVSKICLKILKRYCDWPANLKSILRYAWNAYYALQFKYNYCYQQSLKVIVILIFIEISSRFYLQ